MREETRQTLTTFGDGVRDNTMAMVTLQKSESEQLRALVEKRLETIQTDNGVRLEQMRQTVDEKLQGTLEARLSQSFQQVSERLEQVHRGLGEMQSLATGVGDLKKVLTNVKSRGIWGEIQLGNLLEQTLAPGQFEKNVATTGTNERVEFAIKLPGATDSESYVWLPIDSKFPMEDYQRLVDASERGDLEGIEQSSRDLEGTLKLCAKNIRDRYLAPPMTTDFAILFLPTESLYAEAIRRIGLVDNIQREHRVIFAGPTTLSALLSSLRMGFRTLAIQKRSSEVWKVLGTVKTEFGKYADLLGKVKKKLDQASSSIEDAERKTRTIHRALGKVEAPQVEDQAVALPEVALLDALGATEDVEEIDAEEMAV
jgi:DNA recombination protein RmuC